MRDSVHLWVGGGLYLGCLAKDFRPHSLSLSPFCWRQINGGREREKESLAAKSLRSRQMNGTGSLVRERASLFGRWLSRGFWRAIDGSGKLPLPKDELAGAGQRVQSLLSAKFPAQSLAGKNNIALKGGRMRARAREKWSERSLCLRR